MKFVVCLNFCIQSWPEASPLSFSLLPLLSSSLPSLEVHSCNGKNEFLRAFRKVVIKDFNVQTFRPLSGFKEQLP